MIVAAERHIAAPSATIRAPAGREGVRHAIGEMTELRLLTLDSE